LEEVYYYRFRVRPEAVRRPSAGGYGWIKQAWQGMEIDPRLPFYLPPDSPEPAHTPHGGTR
jgi:hypothetical protein